MKIICSYCRKEMGEKDPVEDTRPSHSICPDCDDHFMRQIKGLPLNDYLGEFDFPIVIINEDDRMIAANKAAERMTGKSSEEISGLLGGEAMECSYARRPEGCGKTVHCETCTIRRAVMAVMETGQPKEHVPVSIRQDQGVVQMVISVHKIDDIVQMVIEKVLAEESD